MGCKLLVNLHLFDNPNSAMFKPNTENINPVPKKQNAALDLRRKQSASNAKQISPNLNEPVIKSPGVQDLYGPTSLKPQREKKFNSFLQFTLVLAVLLSPIISLFIYFQVRDLVGNLKQESTNIFNAFDQAAKRTLIEDYDSANADLETVRTQLQSIQEQIGVLGEFSRLLSAADNLVATTSDLNKLLPEISKIPQKFFALNKPEQADSVPTSDSKEFSKILSTILDKLSVIHKNLLTVQSEIRKVPLIGLNEGEQKRLLSLEAQLEKVIDFTTRYETYLPAIRSFLGYDLPHRYLVLLQNNNELRPGGGFIGSFIIADTNDGVLTKLTPYDVYEFDGQLVTDNPQPEELTGITSFESIRDSNVSPDFARNAVKAAELLEEAGGPSVDTVLAINVSVLEDLLKVTGPIKFAEQSIDANNLSYVLTYLIEAGKEGNENPKQVLFDFINNFKEEIFDHPEQVGEIAQVLRSAISSKNLMAYSKVISRQNLLSGLGITGTIPPVPTIDELLITHTSIGGNKSDRFLKSRYVHKTVFSKSGTVTNELTIRVFHGYTDQIEQQILAQVRNFTNQPIVDAVRYVLGRGDNRTRYKIYVPLGSKITHVSGINMEDVTSKPATDLIHRQLISFIIDLKPGQVKEVKVLYTLPQKLRINPINLYQLTLHKAPGVNNAVFEKLYRLTKGLSLAKTQPEQTLLNDSDTYDLEQSLTQNELFQAIIAEE